MTLAGAVARATAVTVFICCFPCLAADWGYDASTGGSAGGVRELKAVPGTLDSLKGNAAPPSVKNLSREMEPAVAPTSASSAKAIQCWLELFGLVAPIEKHGKLPEHGKFDSSLTAGQKKRFSDYLGGLDQERLLSINGYWGELKGQMSDPDVRANYRLLFRSLLRVRAQSGDVDPDEKSIVLEAIGPVRIAESGPPPLSEEAINAYADMACFLYEQKNPGRSVDADDNRKLFALVIRDKYKKAPSTADRVAMNQFPLNWAKFRILYTDASESQRRQLVKKLASKSSKSGRVTIGNSLLEKVLSSRPWRSLVLEANRLSKGKQAASKANSSASN